ncbi:hypothetical protein KR059_009316 [Drosophila kikkawai]|nr:uncharacterized protein LOC108070466 [Drosophila kikkawai]KAH8315703.1 hypothetical protein KR059_009316 [Drosophila kikkawai]
MSFVQPLLLAALAALYIYTGSASRVSEDDLHKPKPEMLLTQVKKTKNGWYCAGVYCPIERTESCKTTSILKPTINIDHDLVVLCLDGKNFPFCGITRSSRVENISVVELNDHGDMEYVRKERVHTSEGISVPICAKRKKNQNKRG